MRAHSNRWWKRLRMYLSLETLEARTPVSEGIGPALTLSAIGGLAHGQSAPPRLPSLQIGSTNCPRWPTLPVLPGKPPPLPSPNAPLAAPSAH